MPTPAKKKFPGIFVVIAISFVVYLAIVTWVVMFHYKRPASSVAAQNANGQSN